MQELILNAETLRALGSEPADDVASIGPYTVPCWFTCALTGQQDEDTVSTVAP